MSARKPHFLSGLAIMERKSVKAPACFSPTKPPKGMHKYMFGLITAHFVW